MPPYDRKLIVDRRLLLWMLLNVLVHLIARQVRRIESLPRRHGLRSDKRFIFVNQIKARSVNPQVASQLHVAPIPARGQRLVQRQRCGIALPPVDAFQVPAGLHQFVNELLLASAQTRCPKGHWDAPEPGYALLQVSCDLQIRRGAALRRRTPHHLFRLLCCTQSRRQDNEK